VHRYPCETAGKTQRAVLVYSNVILIEHYNLQTPELL